MHYTTDCRKHYYCKYFFLSYLVRKGSSRPTHSVGVSAYIVLLPIHLETL